MTDNFSSEGTSPIPRHVTSITPDELAQVDLEAPIATSRAFSARELGGLYRQAAQVSEQCGRTTDALVYGLLNALLDMHFKPGDRAEPFGPLFVLADGRRSLVPSDIPAGLNAALASEINSFRHPVLKARIADITWLNNRKLGESAKNAISSYCDSVDQLRAGTLLRAGEHADVTDHDVIKRLRRACQIAILTGGNAPLSERLQAAVRVARQDAFGRKYHHGFLETSALDLDFSISTPTDIANEAEALFDGLPSANDAYLALALLERAIRASRATQDKDNEARLTEKSAECCVARANSLAHAPMLESHWLTRAIATYGRVRAKRERRNELRKRLIDVQARTLDDLKPIGHAVDIRDIVEKVKEQVAGKSLAVALRYLVLASHSPSPPKLRVEAFDAIRNAPLSSLFPASVLDRSGKVTLQTSAPGANPSEDDTGLRFRIMQSEGIRRGLLTKSAIGPARAVLHAEHGITTELLLPLMQASPFVPPGYEQVFALGFSRWFGGDLISAMSILAPQLENSLRYVLINAGEDVTTMKSDGTQEDRSISSLFDTMREQIVTVLGDEIAYEIENLFLLRGGPAVRHGIAHGQFPTGNFFSDDADYACWFLLHLCLLPLIPQWEEIEAYFDQAQ